VRLFLGPIRSATSLRNFVSLATLTYPIRDGGTHHLTVARIRGPVNGSGHQGRRRVHLTIYLGDLARTPCDFQIKEILEV